MTLLYPGVGLRKIPVLEDRDCLVFLYGFILTRGVPGTHDTKLLFKHLKNFKSNNFSKVKIPQFDKSKDDRMIKTKWKKIKKKQDIIIFEGWCVGAKAQKKNNLRKPINILEKKKI